MRDAEHPFNETHRHVLAAAERAHAEGGMSHALREAVKTAQAHLVSAGRPDEPETMNRDILSVLVSCGALIAVRSPVEGGAP